MSRTRKLISLLLVLILAAIPMLSTADVVTIMPEGEAKEISLSFGIDVKDENALTEADKSTYKLLTEILSKLKFDAYYSPDFYRAKVIFDGTEELELQNVLSDGKWYEFSPQLGNIAIVQEAYKTTDFAAAMKPYIDTIASWYKGEATHTYEQTLVGGEVKGFRVSRAAISEASAYSLIKELAVSFALDENLLHDVWLYVSGFMPYYYDFNTDGRNPYKETTENYIRSRIINSVKMLNVDLEDEDSEKLNVNITYNKDGSVRSFDLYVTENDGNLSGGPNCFYSAVDGSYCLKIRNGSAAMLNANWKTDESGIVGSIIFSEDEKEKIDFTVTGSANSVKAIISNNGAAPFEIAMSAEKAGEEEHYSMSVTAAGITISCAAIAKDAERTVPNIALDAFDKLYNMKSLYGKYVFNPYATVSTASADGYSELTDEDIQAIAAKLIPIGADIVSKLSNEAILTIIQLSTGAGALNVNY